MSRLHFEIILGVLLALFVPRLAHAEPPPPDRSVWEQVDIIPMPKRIRLTGRRLPLSEAVIVLGAKPSEQDRIGAKWINDHVVETGGKALPVLTSGAGDAPVRIIVGTRRTCPAIEEAAAAKLFRLGPGVPGKHGYVIQPRRSGRGTDLLLGGADPVGALYACVTLAGLLDKDGSVVVREAEVVDWPDYLTSTEGWNLMHPEFDDLANRVRWAGDNCPEELKQEYLRAMKEHLDRLLGWKVSCFRVDSRRRDLSPKYLETFHEVTAYAKARGIHSLIYALKPFVGLRSDFPDAPVRCLTGTGRPRYKEYIRCWSMDEERRKTAAMVGRFVKAAGLTDVGFHDSDTGGFLNPARWEDRCEVCRKRWGDDFAAATVNKHRIYYEEIKKIAPDCRIHFTLYPYNISVLTQEGAERYQIERYGPGPSVPLVAKRLRERFTDFWVRVAKGLPGDVTFCIRENVPENVRRFHELTDPHGTFIWYLVGSKQWRTFFDASPSWAPTFHSGRDDVMFTVSMEFFLPLKALAVREYTWNVKAPGASGWPGTPAEEWWRNAEPKGELYAVVLPHIVRNFFGRRAAPELTKALSLNMAMNHICDYEPTRKPLLPVLTTYEKWRWQAEQAEKGCEILDGLFKRFEESGDRLGMTKYAARRFIYIREVFHCCKWMARAKACNMHARELAKAGKLEEARAAVRLGRETIAKARGDMKRLVAQRPEDPIYNADLDHRKRPPFWKMYTPGNRVDYDVPERMLAETENELTSLAAAGELPAGALEILAKRSTVHVAPASARPRIDGRLDEDEWRRALPAEAFFVYPGGRGLARAHTRARFLRDDRTLYMGVTCWMPGKAPIRAGARERDGNVIEDEQVELFLVPPHMKGGYVQFQINAAGSIADKRITLTRNKLGAEVKKRDPEWNAAGVTVKTSRQPGLWELEAAIPLSALDAPDWKGAWRVNVCRDFKGTPRELSSIMRPAGRNFHDTAAFRQLVFDPTPAPPPDADICVAGLDHKTKTLDDRVATVVEFGIGARASRVLHDVAITAELYDASGRLHARRVVKRLEHLTYFWRPEEEFRIAFDQEVKAGGLRLVLDSDEARCERWARFGGWEGTGKIAPLFSPPEEGAGADDIRSTRGLAGPCNLQSEVAPAGSKKPLRIVGRRTGTIEFWFKHEWRPSHPLEVRVPWRPRHVLLHCGVLRREYPEHFNQSALTVYHDAAGNALYFVIKNRQYAGWSVCARAEADESWARPGWHHIACVWDHRARPADWLRIYIDGERAKAETVPVKPERVGEDKAVELAKTPFAVQVGSFNTGRCPADAVIDELRISRTARYDADFMPACAPLKLDKDTSALFHFDGTLDGEGMTPEGKRYAVRGVAGALELH